MRRRTERWRTEGMKPSKLMNRRWNKELKTSERSINKECKIERREGGIPTEMQSNKPYLSRPHQRKVQPQGIPTSFW